MSFWDSLFGGGSQTQTYDRGTTQARDRIYQLAGQGIKPYQAYSGPGWSAMQGMAQNLGLNFDQLQQMASHPQQFTGDVAAQYMNPYNQQVTDAARREFDLARQSGATNLAGMQGGAFGRGSRGALAFGQMNSDIARQQAGMVAGLQQQGFSDAYNRWSSEQQNQMQNLGNLTNLGLGATDAMRQQFTEGRDWDANQAMRYQQTVTPAMQYADQIQKQSSSPFSQILGAGLGIGSMFMGGGAGAALGMAAKGLGSSGMQGKMKPVGAPGPYGNATPWNFGMAGGGYAPTGHMGFGQPIDWSQYGWGPN